MKNTKPIAWASAGVLALALLAAGPGLAGAATYYYPDGSTYTVDDGSSGSTVNASGSTSASSGSSANSTSSSGGGATGSGSASMDGAAGMTSGSAAATTFGTASLGGSGALSQPALFTSGDLGVGSTGASVAELQGYLAEIGYLTLPPNTALGYFGSLTSAALAKYQLELGLPGTGYFGPLTRAALMAKFGANGWAGGMGTTTGMTGSTAASSSADSRGSWWYNSRDNTWNYTITDVMGTSTSNGQQGSVPTTVIDTTVDDNR